MRFIIPKTFNDYFPGYVIYVDSLSNGEFNAMKIWQFAEDNSMDMYISAKSGTINFDEQSDAFLLKLNDGSAENFNGDVSQSGVKIPQIIAFNNISVHLPANELVGMPRNTPKKLHHMVLGKLLEAKKDLNANKSALPRKEIRLKNAHKHANQRSHSQRIWNLSHGVARHPPWHENKSFGYGAERWPRAVPMPGILFCHGNVFASRRKCTA